MPLVFEGRVVVASGFLFGRAQTEIFLSLSQLCASVDIPSPILVGQSGWAEMIQVLYM